MYSILDSVVHINDMNCAYWEKFVSIKTKIKQQDYYVDTRNNLNAFNNWEAYSCPAPIKVHM